MTDVVGSSELAARIAAAGAALIGIDGDHGSGKTTLARALAETTGVPAVHLDGFVTPGQAAFVAALDRPALARALTVRPLIVEGVCLLAALAEVGVRPDLLVVVAGDAPDPQEARGRGPLADEVRHYRRDWSPERRADVLYRRDATTGQGEGSMQYRVEVDVAYIKAKTALAITLAIGGMVALCVGVLVLLYGVNGQDELLFKVAGQEMSAKGLGGVIMGTSAIWAWCAYRSRPKYSRVEQEVERRDADGSTERTRYASATQFLVQPQPHAAPPAV